jgi:hypothetical protein
MPRKTLAVWIVMLGLALGLLGNLLFYQKALGISFPLFILTAVLVTLAAARPAQTPVKWRNLWPLIPVLFFAGMVAVRDDDAILTLNIMAVFALGGLTLHYLPLERPLDEAPLSEHIASVFQSCVFAIFGAIPEVGDSWSWLRERNWQGRTIVAVVRGLALAVPIMLVFTALLVSADVVFADVVEDAWNLLALNPDARLIDQGVITLSIGWLAAGALAYGLARRHNRPSTVTVPAGDAEAADEDSATFVYGDEQAVPMKAVEASPKRKAGPFIRLSMIETGIILGLVDALFGAFVLVQMAYFFGGQDFINDRGLTYAQYARRGFFELVAVSVLTLGLALWLNHITLRRERRASIIFNALSLIVVALTSVMLISASQRMYLYEEAYGFTHLRVFTHVFMLWLGVLFVFFLLSLFNIKPQIFALGVLLTSIGYLVTLNAMNVDLYLAQRNIERFYQGYALDLSSLGRLSADAVPAVIGLYRNNNTTTEARQWAGQWLAAQLDTLDRQKQNETLFGLNFARQQAWSALDALRSDLPEYDPSIFYSYYSQSYYDVYATEEPFSR